MSEPIKSVEEFIAWTKQLEGILLVYRGMTNAAWEVESSAHLRIKESQGTPPPPPVFQNYMKQLLNSAGLRGFRERQGKSHSDLELLAELQHNGAATCLIDFTTNALIALWFACREKPQEAGKVVAMATDSSERFAIVGYQDLGKAIEEFLDKGKLWKWEPSHLSNRIVAQQSVFVFGEGKIGERHYKAIKVNGSSKEKIREELKERFGIAEQYLFSDFTGFALSNAYDRPYSDYTAEDYFYLGVTFHQQGDYKRAIDSYDQSIALDPQNVGPYYNRGIAKHVLGDYQGAIADFDKALALDPQNVGPYYN
ncbi:MAG: tetratricopeptide repeat protein, partial [Desulfurellaceae bacterium]|nr:tetratricopeptide repeat protein [Desulfurellaceae bacterium]